MQWRKDRDNIIWANRAVTALERLQARAAASVPDLDGPWALTSKLDHWPHQHHQSEWTLYFRAQEKKKYSRHRLWDEQIKLLLLSSWDVSAFSGQYSGLSGY